MRGVFSVLACLLVLSAVAAGEEYCNEGERRVCGTDTGVCETGRSICINGIWVDCEGGKGPDSLTEKCGNGLDDNCDGTIDEGCFPWFSMVLLGMGLLFIGIGLYYMQRGRGERVISEGLAKD